MANSEKKKLRKSSHEKIQDEIRNLAEEYYRIRINSNLPGDAKSDWEKAEKDVKKNRNQKFLKIVVGSIFLVLMVVLIDHLHALHVAAVENQKRVVAYQKLLDATEHLLDPICSLFPLAEKEALSDSTTQYANEFGSSVKYKGLNLKDPSFINHLCALNVKEASGDRIVMEAFNNTKGTIRDAVNNLIVLLTEYPTEIAPEDIRLINELSENGFINEIKNEKSPSNGSVTQLNDLEFFPDYCEDHTKTTGQLKDYGDFIDLALILDYRIVEFRTKASSEKH